MAMLPVDQRKKKKGRPPIEFDQDIADEILALIREDRSILSICKTPGFPSLTAFHRWLANPERDPVIEDFKAAYWIARAESADIVYAKMQMIEEMLMYAQIDWKSAETIIRSMQWRAGKMAPKRYGETLRHVGHDGGPIKVAHSLEDAIHKRNEHVRQLQSGSDPTVDVEIDVEIVETPAKPQDPQDP